MVFYLNPEYCIREIADERILLPVGGAASQENAIFAANGIGMDILCFLRQAHTEQELLAYLRGEYEASDTLEADVSAYLTQLQAEGLVLCRP